MTALNGFNHDGEELERMLQLRTSPIAIRLLENEGDIPEGALRPKRDMGVQFALCQGFAMSRRNKKTVAMLKEDNWCYLPIISFGMSPPPDFFLEGNTYVKRRVAEQEDARRLAQSFPRLESGKYIGLLSAPLKTAAFTPDLVVIYCISNQLRLLLSALRYPKGDLVTSTLDPGGACIQCTVPVIQTGDCQVTIPCGGDRNHALAQDDELIFSVPTSKLEDLMAGLKHFEARGRGYTRYAPDIKPEYPLSDLYIKMGQMVGLDVR